MHHISGAASPSRVPNLAVNKHHNRAEPIVKTPGFVG